MKTVFISALFTVYSATAIAQNGTNDAPARASCLEINRAATMQAASGHLAEAEAALTAATVSGDEGQGACRGHVLSNLARIMSLSGSIGEADRLAEQSVRMLERFYPSDDPVLLRPLQVLAAVRLESGKTARARDVVKRMQSIRIERPEDSVIVHGTAGALLEIEGRLTEAEAEYYDALRALEEAAGSQSADAAGILHCLGSLYLVERRLDEARRVLDRALAIFNQAKDAMPLDRIEILYLRGVLDARLGDWQRSEQDLREAISMADGQPSIDPALLRPLLVNYSYVLRRNHHGREARSVEARAAALDTNRATAAVVDYTGLLARRKDVRRR